MIAAGHSWSEIKHYTIPQIKLFDKYALELEKERRANLIADMAIASQGNSKGITQKIKELLS